MKIRPEEPEVVEIAVADTKPVNEFDAQLECRMGLPDEFVFVDAEEVIEQNDRRNGRLAHPDRADLFRFDERDPVRGASRFRKRSRSHPARRTTTHNDDVADRFRHQTAASILPRATSRNSFIGGMSATAEATSRSRCCTFAI